ncbi:unnamed protein product [Eruca vesicaria subsp. sativa]|uniref:Protein kinase domain-containing protein n=1 Tax=Eruca vesicaria subsp. sativa TaxID=29727 RepID=A0ABC8KKN8_ERUVS|nr:unnamed protein product [Eruca vesicaria subsp. sativa]
MSLCLVGLFMKSWFEVENGYRVAPKLLSLPPVTSSLTTFSLMKFYLIFGASRRVSTNSEQRATLVQGSLGYMDPEYVHTSPFTEKSDAYRFGVVERPQI